MKFLGLHLKSMLFLLHQIFNDKDIKTFCIISTDAYLKIMGFLSEYFMIRKVKFLLSDVKISMSPSWSIKRIFPNIFQIFLLSIPIFKISLVIYRSFLFFNSFIKHYNSYKTILSCLIFNYCIFFSWLIKASSIDLTKDRDLGIYIFGLSFKIEAILILLYKYTYWIVLYYFFIFIDFYQLN